MTGTNGLQNVVQAGQTGNVQGMINSGAQAAGGIGVGNPGQVQNVGGQMAVVGGQIQNGNYVDVMGTGANAVGAAVGGQAGQ